MSLWLQSAKHAARVGAHRSPLMHWLMSLGAVGLFGVAIIDSSVIPLPLPGSTDLFLLLLTAHRGASALTCVLLAFSAWAGSIVGGYTCWSAGRKGGEAALEKRVPPRFLNRLKGWVQRHGSLSIALAAFLPPPIPLLPFLLAAGALGITRTRFLISYAAGRLVRYGLLAWLGATYGRHFVRQWEKTLNHWTAPILYTYAALVAAAIGYGLWQATRGKRAKKSSKGNAPALVSDAWDAAPPQP